MPIDTEEFYEQGYHAGFPTWGLIDGSSIDIQICAESTCSQCGNKGMECKGFIKPETKSYRAFAVCPNCGHVEEF